MEWLAIAVFVLLASGAAGLYLRPSARLERRRRRAAAAYAARVHLPPKLAAESLERAIAEKARRFPGKSRAWYTEQVLLELRRDRR